MQQGGISQFLTGGEYQVQNNLKKKLKKEKHTLRHPKINYRLQ